MSIFKKETGSNRPQPYSVGPLNMVPMKWNQYKNLTEEEKNNGTMYHITDKNFDRIRSYIGMIIQSTTLDTEAKVIEQYGGTAWIQHSGYMLRGADSGVTADNAVKDGGNDDAIVPYHNHSVSAVSNAITGGSHNHKISPGGRTQQFAFGDFQSAPIYNAGQTHNVTNNVTDSSTHTHNLPAHNTNYAGTVGNITNANIPNYKSVYIWERTA